MAGDADLTEALEATAVVASVFDSLCVDFFVGGSLASSLHGIPRSTQDVDLVADIEARHVAPLVATLSDGWMADDAMILDAIRRRAAFNLVRLATMFKVDVFVARQDAFARQEMARRVTFELPNGLRLPVATAEDVVLQKLSWFRLGDAVSERQWRDVVGVLRVGGSSLDRAYLDDWAARMDLGELLARARREADAP